MALEPWSKFFWIDYEADEGLRVCSLAAQGLWMRMLCLMAKATPKGELRIAGEPCSAIDLAAYVGGGASEEMATGLLTELERRGVFSRTRSGVIFCRRMRRDAEISRKRAEAGKIGASVTNGNNDDIHFCRGKSPAKRATKVRPQKPEARSQKPEARKEVEDLISQPIGRNVTTQINSPDTAPDAFARFWQGYPHPPNRGSKAKAEALFGKLSQADRDGVLASLAPLRDYCAVATWYSPKMAETYLNPKNRNWESPPDADAEKRKRADNERRGPVDIFELTDRRRSGTGF